MCPQVKRRLIKLHIKNSNYHSEQYEGNQCRLILRNVHRLAIPMEFIDFKFVLIALRKLHGVCNADFLPHNYVETIDNFSNAWYSLVKRHKISTTPKIHIILGNIHKLHHLAWGSVE